MEENVFDSEAIQLYAKKNTSPKFPIEEKYVNAFLQSLLNSSFVKEKYKILRDEMWNGNSFLFYNSFWKDANIVNKEPNRSIVAYAMLKKDFRLFELMSASLFTGTVEEYHGSDLYSDLVEATDEKPTKYTDSGSYTDMQEGLIQIGFKNVFCDDPLPDGTGSEFQTLEELRTASADFEVMATMCKPARVIFLLFYQRYCFIGGNRETVNTCGVNMDEEFYSPFGGGSENTGVDVLNAMSDEELFRCYLECSMEVNGGQKEMEAKREVIRTENPDVITFRYTFKTQEVVQDGVSTIWGKIKILPSVAALTYVREKRWKEGEDHSEKMEPVMLSLGPYAPDAVLAFSSQDGTPTGIAGMFYQREKAQ
jgi:hypothetical protein